MSKPCLKSTKNTFKGLNPTRPSSHHSRNDLNIYMLCTQYKGTDNALSHFAQEANQGLRSGRIKLESDDPPRNGIKDALQGRGLQVNGPIKAPRLHQLKSTFFGCKMKLRRTYKPLEGRRWWRQRYSEATPSQTPGWMIARFFTGTSRVVEGIRGRFGCRH